MLLLFCVFDVHVGYREVLLALTVRCIFEVGITAIPCHIVYIHPKNISPSPPPPCPANKQRSTILAMAKATEQVDGRQRDATGRRPVASQFCTIL